MDYNRFKQLWDESPYKDLKGIDCSSKLKEALIAYGKGEPSAFDKIKEKMEIARSVARLKRGELKNISNEVI